MDKPTAFGKAIESNFSPRGWCLIGYVSYRMRINDWQNRHERRFPTISKPNDNQQIRMERIQVSHGRTIRVVSVFSESGRCSPEDKLKALIDLEIQKEKLCA